MCNHVNEVLHGNICNCPHTSDLFVSLSMPVTLATFVWLSRVLATNPLVKHRRNKSDVPELLLSATRGVNWPLTGRLNATSSFSAPLLCALTHGENTHPVNEVVHVWVVRERFAALTIRRPCLPRGGEVFVSHWRGFYASLVDISASNTLLTDWTSGRYKQNYLIRTNVWGGSVKRLNKKYLKVLIIKWLSARKRKISSLIPLSTRHSSSQRHGKLWIRHPNMRPFWTTHVSPLYSYTHGG